ncbi:M20/M25/M40 family metallo-hydrolase [Nocardiopsis ganjiahuensis]|uniref:M20/M25/M40 family metallo-hydrolase n=1 Tax=Nocardiopsis ganjiahuensis TaxID=239984 RepID=UPI00034639D1|nr:M20/M25/M40 family metallo-hydrolase [Nocardiopsis ganjiahuensis]
MRHLLEGAERLYPQYLERLAELVSIDSGSTDARGVDAVGDRVAAYLSEAGLAVERHEAVHPDGTGLGNAVVGRLAGRGSGPRILLVGHMDTVFERGTAAARPFSVREGRWAHGPGVCDDKGGLLAGITALAQIAPGWDGGEITLYCGPDEEIGSLGSRSLLGFLAEQADAALCLECARANGDIVSGRKGVADVEVLFRGRAAHAGIDRGLGANAALAAALATVELEALNGRWPDASLNVGVLRAGDRPNVVAGQARLVLDVRAEHNATFDAVLAAVRTTVEGPLVDGVSATAEVVAPAPPWRTGPEEGWLRDEALLLAQELGIDLRAADTGGSADANLVAAHGIPVLDGLGPVGGGDHGTGEWLDLHSVVPRVALLAGLIRKVSEALADRGVLAREAG